MLSVIRSGLFFSLTLVSLASAANAGSSPYVVLQDDGTIEMTKYDSSAHVARIEDKLFALYAAAGQPLPEILSVWTTFPFDGNTVGTYFDPFGADVKGIGLEAFFRPDGILRSPKPPLRCILFHNTVLKLRERAASAKAPEEGYANYLFLLEASHNWGPALRVPGPTPDELIGFPFHWSFFMDAGGSPAGGNQWKDNGDGTFTTIAAKPSAIVYSKLDLYLMGLAMPDEVPAFGVLEGAVVPATPTDPLLGGAYAAHSFPWFDDSSALTVTATRKTFTIDDVIATNGPRAPAFGASPTSWKLGVVLLTSKTDTAESTAAATKIFDSIALGLAPAFNAATSGRGTLEIVTRGVEMGSGGADGGGITDAASAGGAAAGGAGAGGAAGSSSAAPDAGSTAAPASTDGGGCACRAEATHELNGSTAAWLLAGALVVIGRGRRARNPRIR
jgi:hypothetical protein